MKLKFTQKGTSTVEFAMILPFFLIMLFGIMEFGMLLYDKAVITNASREAARSGIAFRRPALTVPELQVKMQDVVDNYIEDKKNDRRYLMSSQSTAATVTFELVDPPPPISNISETQLKVTVTYPYTFFVFGNLFNAYMGGSFTNNQLPLEATTVMKFE
jgi:Flp pilus assembly protein TadG